MEIVSKIVLTGGPCAGKTTIIDYASQNCIFKKQLPGRRSLEEDFL